VQKGVLMDRVELKNKAKKLIKGNIWYLLKPVVIIGLIIGAIEGIAIGLDSAFGLTTTKTVEILGVKTTQTTGGYISMVVGVFTGIASSALSIAYAHYVLSFVRGKKEELKDVIDFMKKNWVKAFIVSLLAGLFIALGFVLLIIPGIIAAIGLMFYQEICADNPEMGAMDVIKKSWEMTKGHKMDLFVIGLSFIGWCLLACLTLGILYIWLMPYMVVTFTLVYEKLKK
jgi:hypothetical protein